MNENTKEAIRFAIIEFFIITVCVMFIISLANLLFVGFDYQIDASFPWTMMLTGLLTAPLSMFLRFNKEPTKAQFYRRVVIHFFCIEAVVLAEGYILGWYKNIQLALIIAAMVLVVYIAVWFFSIIVEKSTAKNINEALKSFNNDEE